MATSPLPNFGSLSNPFGLVNQPAGSVDASSQELQRDFLSVWGTSTNALQPRIDREARVNENQLGGRALRAMQRAFSTMNAIAMGGAAAGGSPLGGNNRDPLGKSSRPMGKSKFGA